MTSFNFKEWLIQLEIISENIIVKYYNQNHVLYTRTEPAPTDIYIDFLNDEFSSYEIYAYKAVKEGHASIGERVTHVGIIKKDPIEAGSIEDFAFLKNLIQELANSKLQPVPTKEQGSFIDTAFKQAKKEGETVPEMDPVETGFTTGQALPDFELGQEDTHQISPGIKVSRATGSWSQFFETINAEASVKKIIECIENAAKPLVNNPVKEKNLIDKIIIVNRMTRQTIKIMQSDQGKQKQENWEINASKKISHLKYLVGEYLDDAPNFRAKLLNAINTYNLKEIAQKSQPKNFGISKQELMKFNDEVYSEHPYIRAFLLGLDDQDKIRQLELLSQQENDFDLMQTLVYYFWQNHIQKFENPATASLYLSVIHKILYTYGNLFQQLEPEQFESLKEKITNQINNGEFNPYDNYEDLLDLSSVLDLHPKMVATFDQLKAEIENKKRKRKEARELQTEKLKYLLGENEAKYLILGKESWQPIPDEYINWHNEIDLEYFSDNIIEDDEDISNAAYEKAEEDALEEVEEKESQSYGKDEQEVEKDIDSYFYDFIDEEQPDEIDENMTDDEAKAVIKKDLKQAFIAWRIEMLQKEEEEESSRYEPEVDESDINKYIKEFKLEKFWQDGFVIMQHVEENEIEITLAKNRWLEFKKILQKTIQYNLKEEGYWKDYTKISINFVPNGGETKSVFDWLQELEN